MEVATEDKVKQRTSPPQPVHRLPPPRGPYEPGWPPYNYDRPNPDQHGALSPAQPPRGPPLYNMPPRGAPHGPPDMYGRSGSIPGPSPAPPESHPAPGTFRPINGSHEQPPHSQPQPPPQQPGPVNFPPRMGFPPDGRHPNGEHHGLPVLTHPDSIQTIPASQPYTPSTPMPPTPGVYEPNSYFLGQGGVPLSTRQRRTTRAQQACDQCRSRKAKCDEGRPSCSHCKENNVPCVYKDVPPQKQERSTQIIVQRIDQQEETEKVAREELMAKLNEMTALLSHVKSQMDSLTGSTPSKRQANMVPDLAKVEADADLIAENLKSPENYTPAERPVDVDMDRPLHPADNDGTQPLDTTQPLDELKDESTTRDTGELSIPIEHTTAAHKLLQWPSIQKLLPEKIDEDYVMHLEESRGPLRLYGQGEGDDDFPCADSPVTSPPNTLEYDNSMPAATPVSAWGSGFQFPRGPDLSRFATQSHPGGLTSSGKLNLEAEVIQTYYQSYLDNMHALHPFLEPTALYHMINRFTKDYSPRKPLPAFSPSLPQPTIDTMTRFPRGKRKRSLETAFEMSGGAEGAPSPVIHKSLDNAIVLLVLALGSICSVKTEIPGPVTAKYTQPTSPYEQIILLPKTANAASFHSPPNDEYNSAPTGPGHSRRVSVTASSPEDWSSPNTDPSLRNIDVIPGLAYFALASDILGDVLGGGGLKHTQACLLAALYTGQLARPFSSHAWICEASRACQILLRPRTFGRLAREDPLRDRIQFAFWTCLQLESDILAELDLPASGISRFEDRLYKGKIFANPPELPDPLIMVYYLSQIHLRKVLNCVHTELYKAESQDSGDKKASWSTKVQEALSCNLESWRTGLPEDLRWQESDPPSDNIIIARMRAKYYGARYIIHRPLLHHALHPMYKLSPGIMNSVASPSPSNVSSTPPQASPPAINPAHVSQNMERHQSHSDMGPPNRPVLPADQQQPTIKSLDSKVHKACQACIDSAIQSTIAFDRIQGRPIVTNIFGTAHAQFGNMLVLSATYMSPLSQLVERNTLKKLLDRTIRFLLQSRHISPTLKKDAEILALIRRKIFETPPSTSFSSADGT
ncbi:hypothetical protein AJ79_06457 [Helicocarpus griseus UAMH5409]|uniref:Zn(2)-C6 fungal-type domain-containing protein n=1 Tax=Helicocarpus griseus UAMH5409 TaxID=1447875 RepID=A0A2B7XD50_9EURO|nr:hypothetical protein AJ79_06457 [Helicocarpus griseus UAMH5409]